MTHRNLNEAGNDDANCPTDQELSSFLADDYAMQDPVITNHIGACDTCQSRLAVLTSNSSITTSSKPVLPSYLSGLEHQLAVASRVPKLPAPDLPGYEILEVIGRGGMGVVYRARHIQLGREVALKVMAAGAHASPDYHRRLGREGQLLAKLNCPSIVQIFDSGEHDGLPYLALELITHGSLAERREQFRSPNVASRLIEILARATHVAHEQGIVHRDLKPANILLEVAEYDRAVSDEHCIQVDGTRIVPKIADFGLSKASIQEGAVDVSVSKAMIGTPQYMSPEQATEDMDRIGPATDIHALGVILYELLTGKRPFDAAGALNTLQRIRSDLAGAPSVYNPDVDKTLDAIVLKCLEKDPTRRFESAAALADEVSRYRSGLPTRRVFVGTSSSLTRRSLLAIALLGLAAFAGWIIKIQTNRGTIVIRCDDPRIEVIIRRGGEAVESFQVVDNEKTKVIRSGDVQIEIPTQYLDSYSVSDSSFELKRGDKKIVTISKRLTEHNSARRSRVSDADNSPAPQWEKMTQREIAKWALSRQAEVVLSSHPHYDYLVHALPKEDLIVSGIAGLWHLTSDEMKLFEYLPELEMAGPTFGRYGGDALASLNHCPNLNWLNLNASKITDNDLKLLDLDNIRFLMLTGCKTTGTSLPKLAAAPNLRHLGIAPLLASDPLAAIWFPKMTNIEQFEVYAGGDLAWTHVAKLPSVTKLKFAYSQGISDAGIESIAKCTKVTTIDFFQVDFRKADLRKLKTCEKLKHLWFNQCQLGNISVNELNQLFPNCKVTGVLLPKN